MIILLCLGLGVYFIIRESRQTNREVTFSYCLDGDSFVALLNEEEIEIRMLAIDCPEKEDDFGLAARDFSRELLENAGEIELVEEKGSRKDKYGRYLFWVFVDGRLLQSELVANGLAKVDYIYGDYQYLDELKAKEKEAKDNKLGIWSIEE